MEEIEKSKKHFKLGEEVPVYSCYEAGRDGFWIHRYLESVGICNIVVDSSSIEVNRRFRRAKSDRIDAEKLLTMLIRYINGEQKLWSVLHIPTPEQEDVRRISREIERLKKERTGQTIKKEEDVTYRSHQTNKKSGVTYVYDVVSVWHKELGQVCVGKLDPVTGEFLPSKRLDPRHAAVRDPAVTASAQVVGPVMVLDVFSKRTGLEKLS